MQTTKTLTFFFLVLLTASFASAETFSLIDEKYLPLRVINDPITHENERITQYSFEQLDLFLHQSPNFLRWNDRARVCASMRIMFNRVSEVCNLPTRRRVTYEEPVHYVSPTTTATVAFEILPQRAQHRIVHVQPRYPPYNTVYRPYRWA